MLPLFPFILIKGCAGLVNSMFDKYAFKYYNAYKDKNYHRENKG